MTRTTPSIWFMNHLANPVVRLLLRSPLHGLLSRAVLLLTVRGRRSGKVYAFPVQYVRDGDTVYVVPGMADRKTWWRNLRGGGRVRLRIQGRDVRGTGEVLEGVGATDVIVAGLTCYLRRFPQAGRSHHVRIDARRRPDPDDVRAAASHAIIVRIRLSP